MPMFDPVKDAIENSPVAQTQPLPPTPSFKHDLLAPSPTAPHVEPPSPGHRSGSLHMLLNAANDAPRPAKRQRTSSLAHLLSPTDAPGLQLDTAPDPSSSPLRSYPRRPSDPNAAMPPPALPPPRAPSVPYAPRRISQPRRCHIPFTSEERAALDGSCRNSLRTGPPRSRPSSSGGPVGKAAPILSPSPGSRPGSSSGPRVDARVSPDAPTRASQDGDARPEGGQSRKRRHQSDEPDDHSQRSANGWGDSQVVAQHYNQRKEVGRQARQGSVIIGLRSFNNWIKSVLIAKFCRRPFHESATRGTTGRNRAMSGKVLDLGCGKGGDLNKWSKAGVKEYVGLDIAAISISQAENRYMEMAPSQRFDAEFHAFDCFSGPIDSIVSPERLRTPFDVVSMQFCMHYAFESLQKVRVMLKNVSDYLRPGGIFLGTIPNSELLLSKLNQLPGDELSFGNPVYRIRFDSKEKQPLYGHRYWFFLRDAVEDVPEYVVRWEEFKALSLEYGLKAVYRSEFHEIFADERRDSEFGPLLQRMKVVNARGDSAMTEDQWDAANIYIGFAFEKQ